MKTFKITYYFNSLCFKERVFQHSLSLDSYHRQNLFLLSKDLYFHPFGREKLTLVWPLGRQDGCWPLDTNISWVRSSSAFLFVVSLLLFLSVLMLLLFQKKRGTLIKMKIHIEVLIILTVIKISAIIQKMLSNDGDDRQVVSLGQ